MKDFVEITLNHECNLKCEFCLLKLLEIPKIDFSDKKIKEALIEGKENNINSLVITGWEPTISNKLINLLILAQKYNYKNIELITNGLFLSKEFCEKIKRLWVNILTISMNWYNKEIFEIQAGKKNTYYTFIKNLIIAKNFFHIKINIVVNSYNVKKLNNHWKLLLKLWITNVTLIHVIPLEKNYNILPNNHDIKQFVNEFISRFNANLNITLEFFPYCLIENKNLIISSNHDIYCITNNENINSRRDISNKYKILKEKCKNCSLQKQCGWFWV